MYYFFLAVVVIRYETTAPARRALLLIVGAFFNDTITVAVWTGFHVRLMGMLPQPRDYIRRCFADPAIAARPHDVRLMPIADIVGRSDTVIVAALIVVAGCHLQGVALRLVVIYPELRLLLRQYVGDALHRGQRLVLVGVA